MIKDKNEKNRRKSLRLPGYDYTQNGAYFITLCTHNRECIFGEVVNDEMIVNEFGCVVESDWLKTAEIRDNIELDEFIIMPNHMHGIIIIPNASIEMTNQDTHIISKRNVGATRWVALTRLRPNSIGSIIGQLKSITTKEIRKMGIHNFKWQRNYYEHIIRKEKELYEKRKYIQENTLKWELDKDNPINWNNGEYEDSLLLLKK